MAYIGNQPISAAFLTDTFSGNGSSTAFTLTVAPANTSSILVAVTGVLQSPDTYSVSGTTLTFSAAPPSGTSNISVRYLGIPASGVTTTAYRTVTNFTATAGQTSFSVPSYTVGYIDVYRNGVRLVSTDYTATTGTTVVLNNACTVGDSVVTESFLVSSVLNAIPATAGSVSTSYLVDGSVTQAKLSTNVAGNGPIFRVYSNATQSLPSSTTTKILFQSTAFDTASAWNSSTSNFTPNVAGYYQVSLMVRSNTTNSEAQCSVWKNGDSNQGANGTDVNVSSGTSIASGLTAIFYMNGTTDYLTPYVYVGAASTTSSQYQSTYFCGLLIRAT